jgi:hypothetical protein
MMEKNNYKSGYSNIDWSSKIDFGSKRNGVIFSKRSDFPTPMISGDYQAYECPVTGKTIDGRRAHEDNLKTTNCRILETGEKEANTRNAAIEAKAEDKRRDAAIDGIVDSVANDYFN